MAAPREPTAAPWRGSCAPVRDRVLPPTWERPPWARPAHAAHPRKLARATLRFLFCSYDARGAFGGPLVWLTRLAPELRRLGHDVRFAFLTDHPGPECATVAALCGDGFDCHWLRRHSVLQYNDNTEYRVRWYIDIAARLKPDIFVANSVLQAIFAARWVRAQGVPTVVVLHSSTSDRYFEGIYDVLCGGDGEFVPSGLVGVSEALAREARVRTRGRTVIESISCGCPVPNQSAQLDPTTPLRLAYVGKFTERPKRISDVARALCLATREVARTEAVLFGDGRDAHNAHAIVHAEGHHSRVSFGGAINSVAVQRALLQCHVIVLMSEWEGLPVALLEAMACGVVPVCFDCGGGVAELVRDGDTGILIRDREASFVAAIRSLRSDVSLWKRLSVHARDAVSQQHSIARVARRWEALGRRLVLLERRHSAGGAAQPLSLPPIHAALSGEDVRMPTARAYLVSQYQRLRGRLLRGARWLLVDRGANGGGHSQA